MHDYTLVFNVLMDSLSTQSTRVKQNRPDEGQ